MIALTTVLRYEIWIFLTVLAAVIVYQLSTGRINTRGLLRDKMKGRGFSPSRLQLLMATMAGALYYLLLIFANEKPGEFPEVPRELVMLVGGSHVFFLGGKLSALLTQKLGLSLPRKTNLSNHD
jgi:hypothetical protein